MPLDDRYELLDGQNWGVGGTDIVNAYFYKQTAGTTGTAAGLINNFLFYVMPALLAVQTAQIVHTLVAARNLDDPLDYASQVLVANNIGLVLGDVLPKFVAWSFRYNRTRSDMNHGYKRIAGVPESWSTAGVADASILGTLGSLATVLAADLTDVPGNTFRPVIMRRLLDAQGHLIGYQEFAHGGVQYQRVTSQNTRKT